MIADRQSVRTVRVVLAAWRSELAGAAEYRTDLLTGIAIATIWLAISSAPVLILATHSTGAGGWTVPRLLLLQAVWYLLDALIWCVLVMNIGYWDEQVRQGTLDGVLLRPVSSLVMCSLSKLHVPDVPKVVLAIGLGVVAVVLGGGPVGVLATIAFIASVLSALVLMWATAVLCNYKVISKVQFDGWAGMFAVLNLSRVPTPLYGATLRIFLTAVVPVAFFATVPAQLFFGDASPWVGLVAVALAAGAIRLASFLWRRELLRYTGAMG